MTPEDKPNYNTYINKLTTAIRHHEKLSRWMIGIDYWGQLVFGTLSVFCVSTLLSRSIEGKLISKALINTIRFALPTCVCLNTAEMKKNGEQHYAIGNELALVRQKMYKLNQMNLNPEKRRTIESSIEDELMKIENKYGITI